MNYTLHQLQIFLKITQTKSITQAAEELHLTQPAVSIQLRNFQQQFDIPLTEIVGRKIYITDFGKEIALAAEEILNQVQAINMKTMEFKGQLVGRLKISIVSTGKYVMPYFLSGFMKEHPGVQLQMDVTNKSRVIESLQDNEVDFSLVSILPPSLNVDKLELMQNKLFLVGSSVSQFQKKSYDKNIFEELPLIYREEGSGTRMTMERFIERNRIAAVKKVELTSNEAVKQAVIAGLGYSIMPLIGIKNELNAGVLRIIPVKGLPISTKWSMIWLKGKMFSPIAKAYLEYVRKTKKEIIEQRFNWYEQYL
ncbi:LysR family transcriptional regulator [Flavihumibacter sp. RY-1]|uniref:LysR family transcriptional regulator n=1 Tax=Flavihumibacter fluminis TaxID=2909236 RepID=A0ABS9BEK7_9BACT|nr:LysR family transcriptional regulator [Flavihumibacter fluminis]MCF1713755.1 LysR family transcriptional regulator [Flavihumibacter fluminis]